MSRLHRYYSVVKLIKSRSVMLLVLVSILWLPSLNLSSAAIASKSFPADPRFVRIPFQDGGGRG